MASTHADGSVGVDGARCESHISIVDENATTLRAWGTKGTKREHPIGAMGRLVVQIASHSLPARAHKSHTPGCQQKQARQTQDVSESKHPKGAMGRIGVWKESDLLSVRSHKSNMQDVSESKCSDCKQPHIRMSVKASTPSWGALGQIHGRWMHGFHSQLLTAVDPPVIFSPSRTTVPLPLAMYGATLPLWTVLPLNPSPVHR